MKEYLTIANSPLMFVLCSIVILFVVVQAVLFMRRAWKHGTEIGLDNYEKHCHRQRTVFHRTKYSDFDYSGHADVGTGQLFPLAAPVGHRLQLL